jgi:hypothetical protein
VINVRDDGLIKIKWLDGDKVPRTASLAKHSLPHMHQLTLMLQLVEAQLELNEPDPSALSACLFLFSLQCSRRTL